MEKLCPTIVSTSRAGFSKKNMLRTQLVRYPKAIRSISNLRAGAIFELGTIPRFFLKKSSMTSYDRIATLLLSSELFLRKNSKSFLTSYAPIAALLVASELSLRENSKTLNTHKKSQIPRNQHSRHSPPNSPQIQHFRGL